MQTNYDNDALFTKKPHQAQPQTSWWTQAPRDGFTSLAWDKRDAMAAGPEAKNVPIMTVGWGPKIGSMR
jgi:hypothetical protein